MMAKCVAQDTENGNLVDEMGKNCCSEAGVELDKYRMTMPIYLTGN